MLTPSPLLTGKREGQMIELERELQESPNRILKVQISLHK